MRGLSRLALFGYLALLLFGALMPTAPSTPVGASETVVVSEGLFADFIRNLILLLPLGWLLAMQGLGALRVTAIGFALSLLIEIAQCAIPGRHPTAIDLLANTASAATGAWLFATRGAWLMLRDDRVARRLARLGFAAACVALVLGVQADRLPIPARPSFAGLRPELGHFERYAGRVVDARVGGFDLRSGPIANHAAVALALMGDAPVVIHAELVASTGRAAPLLTVHDADQRELFVFFADGRDLVAEWRTYGAVLAFERPAHRWTDVLPSSDREASEVSEIRLERAPGRAELWIDERWVGTHARRPAEVWSLLVPGRIVPGRLEAVLDAVTILLLALPSAYYAARPLLPALGLAALMSSLSQAGPVVPPAAPEWIGLGLGFAFGRLARALVTRTTGRAGLWEGPL